MKIYLSILSLFLMLQLTAQHNISEVGRLPYPGTELSDVWGYVDGSGKEYALVGVYDAFSVVDISTPSSPVEVFNEPGSRTIWRDIKVWNNHAYIVHDGTNGGDPNMGLLIVDLSTLPANPNLNVTYYTGSTYTFGKAHNLYIDENGICYLFGSNTPGGGTIMLDLTNDPMNPTEVGIWDDYYCHDGVVRNDTLWASCINDGIQVTVNVADKSNPLIMGSWATPNNYAHNCWFSDNGETLFTTDEVGSAFITSYDVRDLGNVIELDRFQSNPGSDVIPHNAHYMNDYVITSYYRDGVNVLDVSHPEMMVETGIFDTAPTLSGYDFNGAWGAYPWLPSGLLLVTDIEEGLFVLDVTYTRASFLTGLLTDSTCAGPIKDVKVEILGEGITALTGIDGRYTVGGDFEGLRDVRYTKAGYDTVIVDNVNFQRGVDETASFAMYSNNTFLYHVKVTDELGAGLFHSQVKVYNGTTDLVASTDNNGEVSWCDMVPGSYSVVAGGLWGYKTTCYSNEAADSDNDSLTIVIETGYYDDFSFDLNWTTSGDATTGQWDRGIPVGTDYNGDTANPDADVDGDCLGLAYVTTNGPTDASSGDVDNGEAILSSPLMDLTGTVDPYINLSKWFFNDGGSGTPNDSLKIYLVNGSDSVLVDWSDRTTQSNSAWSEIAIRVLDHTTLGSSMQVVIVAGDYSPGHLVEGGIDRFYVSDLGSPAVAAFSAVNNVICVGDQVEFINNSTNADTHEWIFDNAGITGSNFQSPEVMYVQSGTMDVTLVVTNGLGTDTLTLVDYITVHDVPEITMSVSATTVTGASSYFGSALNSSSTSWDMGDGNVFNVDTLEHNYPQNGSYVATYTASNAGCSREESVTIVRTTGVGYEKLVNDFELTIYPNPIVDHLFFESTSEKGHIYIYDVKGRLVFAKTDQILSRPVSISLASDLYFVKVVDSQTAQSTTKKILVK